MTDSIFIKFDARVMKIAVTATGGNYRGNLHDLSDGEGIIIHPAFGVIRDFAAKFAITNFKVEMNRTDYAKRAGITTYVHIEPLWPN